MQVNIGHSCFFSCDTDVCIPLDHYLHLIFPYKSTLWYDVCRANKNEKSISL